MTFIEQIVPILAAIVASIIAPLILLRSQRRKAEAEADTVETANIVVASNEWKELYEKSEQGRHELDAKVDELYRTITKHREKENKLNERINELTLRNQALEFRKCNKHGCPDREPPSDF